jgi:PAS domain S-box-containing protein
MTQPPRDVLQSQLGELQALLDATVDAVVLIDHRGLIESFNRSGERLFGYRADELIGRNVSVLMTARDSGSHDGYMGRYMKTGVAHIIGVGREVDARRKDGSVFPAVLSVGQVRDSDPPRFVGLLHDITLRREAMAALRRERDRANLYLEVAQVILVGLSGDGRVQLINRKGCETLGRREIDLLGHDWVDAAVPPEQRAEAHARLTALARREISSDLYVEYDVMTAAGPRRLIAWRCVALRDAQDALLGFLCSGEDITDRRSIEQSMARTQALLNEAQEIANFGNFEVYHPPTGDAFWSPQLFRIFGLDPAIDVPNAERLAAELIHADDLARFAAEWDAARSAPGNRSGAYRIITPAGEVRHVQITSSTTPWQGERMRIAGTVLDVTEATRAAEQARESQQRMTHVSRLATMGEMAAGIAHELNQPLAAIANYASAASRLTAAPDDSIEDIKLSLEQIAAQALRAGEIIRRLRSLVQNRETRREPAEVNDLVAEVVSFSQSDARLHDVQIRLEPGDDLPVLWIDRIQIQQILLNLVRNAIEAMEGVPPQSRLIAVSTECDGDTAVIIKVTDSGPGVPAALVAKIFDPFCTTKESGTGLGLAISRTIAEAHQGKLTYQRAPGGGARFILRLPSPQQRNER